MSVMGYFFGPSRWVLLDLGTVTIIIADGLRKAVSDMVVFALIFYVSCLILLVLYLRSEKDDENRK